jgi:DNA-binding LytR/AlgR family response regulator
LIERLRTAAHISTPARTPRVLVRVREGHRLVPFADVILFRARSGSVSVTTSSGEYATDYTLSELEDRTGRAFVRPNRSELINVDQIVSIASNGDGSATLTLSDGNTIHVTRRRAAAIRRTLDT